MNKLKKGDYIPPKYLPPPVLNEMRMELGMSFPVFNLLVNLTKSLDLVGVPLGLTRLSTLLKKNSSPYPSHPR
jgi:hypothetical protein